MLVNRKLKVDSILITRFCFLCIEWPLCTPSGTDENLGFGGIVVAACGFLFALKETDM